MKKISLIIICISLFLFTNAQNTQKGFYLNPNINFSSHISKHSANYNFDFAKPQIGIGYLFGNKIRHNFNLYSLNSSFGRNNYYFGAGLKYSMDIKLLETKRLKLFASPFIKSEFIFNNYRYNNQRNSYGNTLNMIGIAPQLEYKLGKKVDFVFSLPINLLGVSKEFQYSKNYNYSRSNNMQTPSIEANIGIRINLFNNKKK